MKISVSGYQQVDAGEIKLTLTAQQDHIAFSGTHEGVVSYQDHLDLEARGRDGLDGLIGADGRDGTPGFDGMDATQFTWGTNGGPGGNGEHGVAGTHGGPAGKGGTIEVSVDESDLALLPLINKTDVSAGRPGRAGRHGRGGMGGHGGRGGASFFWTSPYTVDHTVHYRDDQGHMHTRVDYTTHYNNHFQPGGTNGPDGRPGGAYTYPLYPGAPAANGKVKINITREGAVIESHEKPFQLSVENVSFKSAEGSGLWEPGDTVTAVYKVINTGPTMISPAEVIPLVLQEHGDLELIQVGEVAGSINAGGEHVSEIPLTFKIKALRHHKNSRPYETIVPIAVDAKNIRLHRSFPGASTTNHLTVQHPVLLEPQITHFSIAQDEVQTLHAKVKNIALKQIGTDAGRQVMVEIVPDQVKARTDVMPTSIHQLDPSNIYQIEQDVRFSPDAELGTQLHFHANLYLQPIDRSERATLIQQQPLTVQLTPKYLPSKSGFLLVVNSATSPAAIKYWMKTLSQMAGNGPISIWNTSYYGHFTLDGHPSLLADTSHGTVVILDNPFEAGIQKTPQRNSQHLTQQQLFKASIDHDVSLLVVGKEGTVPTAYRGDERQVSWTGSTMTHDRIDRLMYRLLHPLEQSNEFILTHHVTVPLQKNHLFFTSPISAMQQAEDLRISLAKIFPHHRYHVAVSKESTTSQQAILLVHRLADPLDSEVKKMLLSDVALVNPVMTHESNQAGLIGALPFSQKLRLFTQTGHPYHRQLSQAITVDLLAQQDLLLQSKTYGSWWQLITRRYQHNFRHELKKLRQLVDGLQQMSLSGDIEGVRTWSPLVIQMIAAVQYHAEQHSSFWTRLANWFLSQNNEQIKKHSLALCQQALVVHSKIAGMDNETQQQATLLVKQQIDFKLKLKSYIQKNKQKSNDDLSCCFFRRSYARHEELVAAKQLLDVCNEHEQPTALLAHLEILNRAAAPLRRLFREYRQLYPELIATIDSYSPTKRATI